MMESGDDKKSEKDDEKEKKPPVEGKGPPKDPESDVGNPEKSPWKPGGPRKKRDGQESDEERLDRLKEFMWRQLDRAKKSNPPPDRDQVPPRDFLTGLTADYANIFTLKPDPLDNFSDREAFASRQMQKAIQDVENIKGKTEKLEKLARQEADSAVKEPSQATQRRDVTGKFSEGRSSIGGAEEGGKSNGGRRDLTGSDSVDPGDSRASASGRRDVTGRSPAAAEGGETLPGAARRRDITAAASCQN